MAGDLGIDEAVDGLMADEGKAILERQPSRHLLGREAVGKTLEDDVAKLAAALQFGAGPASGASPVLSLGRSISLGPLIALQFASNARWRAIQSCSNFPERTAFGLKSGNLAAVFQ